MNEVGLNFPPDHFLCSIQAILDVCLYSLVKIIIFSVSVCMINASPNKIHRSLDNLSLELLREPNNTEILRGCFWHPCFYASNIKFRYVY